MIFFPVAMGASSALGIGTALALEVIRQVRHKKMRDIVTSFMDFLLPNTRRF
jgi:hypothetical protein